LTHLVQQYMRGCYLSSPVGQAYDHADTIKVSTSPSQNQSLNV
jgi:hypothetical protein